jgi:hypothetical protein
MGLCYYLESQESKPCRIQPLGLRLPRGGSISQEVKPEDKMGADSQSGDIIAPSRRNRRPGLLVDHF